MIVNGDYLMTSPLWQNTWTAGKGWYSLNMYTFTFGKYYTKIPYNNCYNKTIQRNIHHLIDTWMGPNKELLRATGKAHCRKPHSVFVSDMK